MKKDKWITLILLVILLISVCIILYAETNVFKKIADWFVWFYNGLRDFNWNN